MVLQAAKEKGERKNRKHGDIFRNHLLAREERQKSGVRPKFQLWKGLAFHPLTASIGFPSFIIELKKVYRGLPRDLPF